MLPITDTIKKMSVKSFLEFCEDPENSTVASSLTVGDLMSIMSLASQVREINETPNEKLKRENEELRAENEQLKAKVEEIKQTYEVLLCRIRALVDSYDITYC